ncbi:MAG: hypothetical protein EBS01_04450 [Verrucomicrobia bacterium]|nr:hypothetical protein [Verrucomicrobiota bacterium]
MRAPIFRDGKKTVLRRKRGCSFPGSPTHAGNAKEGNGAGKKDKHSSNPTCSWDIGCLRESKVRPRYNRT